MALRRLGLQMAAAATAGVLWGARMVRTHDVGPTRDALRVATALLGGDAEANPS